MARLVRWRLGSVPVKWSTCWPRRRLVQHPAKTLQLNVEGELAAGVTAKDLILYLIGSISTAGGTGYVIEYTGSAIRGMSMEQRMTVCNMSIEAGARAGMIAPDQTTFDYLRGREFAPPPTSSIALRNDGRILPEMTMPVLTAPCSFPHAM